MRPSPDVGSSQFRVLLVDDDQDVLFLYARSLRAAGHRVEVARDGAEALTLLTPHSHDVVVTDIAMPRLNGLALLSAMRDRDLAIPVVLMTGDPQLDTALGAVEHGAARYLIKPVDTAALLRTVVQSGQFGVLERARRRAVERAVGIDPALSPEALLPMDERFRVALDRLWIAWQPIVNVRAEATFAYEALLRTAEPTFPTAGSFLDAAERLGRLPELGRAVRARVATEIARAPADAMLFVNLHPSDLTDPALYEPHAALATHAGRVVLEITERASLESVDDVAGRIARLRGLGFGIAVDDLGAGYAGLNAVVAIQPDVVKLDMLLVRGLDHDRSRQEVVHSMVVLASNLGMRVIAEGVETAAERDALSAMGCVLMQGWHFGRPVPAFERPALG